MTQLVDRERASAIMDERNIDVLLGAGFINYGAALRIRDLAEDD